MRPPGHIITIFIIYNNPSDYPGKFVLREQHITRDSQIVNEAEPLVVSDDVTACRAACEERGLFYMPRHPEDEPQIMETWI